LTFHSTTYVENSNGTEEQRDLHDLPVLVITFRGVIVVLRPAMHNISSWHCVRNPHSHALRYAHGNISSAEIVQWRELGFRDFSAISIHKFAIAEFRILRAHELLVPGTGAHCAIDCSCLHEHQQMSTDIRHNIRTKEDAYRKLAFDSQVLHDGSEVVLRVGCSRAAEKNSSLGLRHIKCR